MFTQSDHDDLVLAIDLMDWASELLNGVLDRHPHDLTMQTISFLCGAKRDADLGHTMVDAGDIAEAAAYSQHAAREAGMADKYIEWQDGAA